MTVISDAPERLTPEGIRSLITEGLLASGGMHPGGDPGLTLAAQPWLIEPLLPELSRLRVTSAEIEDAIGFAAKDVVHYGWINGRLGTLTVSPERARRIKRAGALREDGASVTEIADRLDISYSAAYGDVSAHSLPLLPGEGCDEPVTAGDAAVETVARLAADGTASTSEIAAAADLAPHAVRAAAKRAAVRLRPVPEPSPHGHPSRYRTGCRCDPCTDAQRVAVQAYREERRAAGVPPEVHGTTNGYTNWRCRCDPCKDANAAYQREAAAMPEGFEPVAAGAPWTRAEERRLLDASMAARDVALELGRTTRAVRGRQHEVRKRVRLVHGRVQSHWFGCCCLPCLGAEKVYRETGVVHGRMLPDAGPRTGQPWVREEDWLVLGKGAAASDLAAELGRDVDEVERRRKHLALRASPEKGTSAKPWSAAEDAVVFAEGKTVAEIAAELGRSRDSVSARRCALRRTGPAKPKRRWTREEERIALDSSLTDQQVAEELGRTPNSVAVFRSRHRRRAVEAAGGHQASACRLTPGERVSASALVSMA